ncbi:Uncharacterised protein g2645 [Pycnogonum litorale]
MMKTFLLFCALLACQLEDGVVTADETCDLGDLNNSLKDCFEAITGYTKSPEDDMCTSLEYSYGTFISCLKGRENMVSISCYKYFNYTIQVALYDCGKNLKKYNCEKNNC